MLFQVLLNVLCVWYMKRLNIWKINNDILNIIDEKESNINKQKKLIYKYENETLIKKCENLLKKK